MGEVSGNNDENSEATQFLCKIYRPNFIAESCHGSATYSKNVGALVNGI